MNHEKQYIGWFCTYTPIEIIEAAGYIPYGIKEDSGQGHEDVYLGDSICPYVRSCFGGALSRNYDSLSGVVIAHSCECMRRLYDGWYFKSNEIIPHCMFFLDIPKTYSEESILYFANQLYNFIKKLEDKTGKPVIENLPRVIKEHNTTRLLFHRIFDMCKLDNPPITGSQINILINKCMKEERKVFNENLKTIIPSLQNTKANRGPRIMIYGALANPGVISAVEETGGIVVYTNTCSGYRFISNPVDENDDPIIALAKRYLGKLPCPRMLGTIAHWGLQNIKSIIDEYRIDGIIYYSVKFCANVHLTAGIIKNEFDLGIPVKIIEGDIGSEIDKREIQSFIKALIMKKSRISV